MFFVKPSMGILGSTMTWQDTQRKNVKPQHSIRLLRLDDILLACLFFKAVNLSCVLAVR